MEIVNEFKNSLLKRQEISFLIKEDSNPGFENVRKAIVEKLKVADDSVVVKNVKSKFGTNEFLVQALIYDSKEDLEKIEPKVKEKKKSSGEGSG